MLCFIDFGKFYFVSIVLFVIAVLIVFFLKRLLAWLDKMGYITYTGHVPTYGSLGHAFLELQSLTEPGKQYVLEMKEDEEEKLEEDDEGGPDDPTAHLRRKAPRKTRHARKRRSFRRGPRKPQI